MKYYSDGGSGVRAVEDATVASVVCLGLGNRLFGLIYLNIIASERPFQLKKKRALCPERALTFTPSASLRYVAAPPLRSEPPLRFATLRRL